jgi:competence protein ComEC
VSFLDVGQGDAALIQTPGGEEVLIDGGPSEAGPRVIEALHSAGVRQIDLLLGSHPHEDHIGGLMDVLVDVPVKQALDPGYAHGTSLQRKYLELLKTKGVKTTRARRGQRYDLQSGVQLEILAPEDPLVKGTSADANNNSVVARLTYGSTAFLFTGDMEEEERERLIQSVPHSQLRSDVLKVAHHGSHNGTDPQFLQIVQPRYAVISLARGNDYGHPHQEAVEALEQANAQILRTDQRGTVVFTSDGRQVHLQGAPATPTRNSAQSPAPAAKVIGNDESHVYHAPNCARLPAHDKQVMFNSAAEAKKAGYHPHAACTRGTGRP